MELEETNKLREELKKKHGKIRELLVPLDEDEPEKKAVIFLKKPDMTTRNMVSTFAMKNKPVEAIKACLNALYIGGDKLELIYSSDDAMTSLDFALAELLSVQRTEIKKN